MAEPLSLTGLRIRVGERVLVDDVGLDVVPGRLLAMVGQSGSGKSLTSKALLGLVDLKPGVVAADLRVPDGALIVRPYESALGRGARARDRAFRSLRGRVLGYLPQDAVAALDPLARVGHQVAVVARLSGGDPDPLPWLARAHLDRPERVAALYPHELSGGMAQRVVIAQTLARGSRFVLADEPTSALDPTVQHRILLELRALADAGLGVLLVTHDLRVLPGLADDIIILHGGRVAERTTPERLRAGDVESEAARRLVQATRRVSAGVLG